MASRQDAAMPPDGRGAAHMQGLIDEMRWHDDETRAYTPTAVSDRVQATRMHPLMLDQSLAPCNGMFFDATQLNSNCNKVLSTRRPEEERSACDERFGSGYQSHTY